MAKIARRVKVSESCVRNTLKNIGRALGERTRSRGVEARKKRRKAVKKIALEVRYVQREGRKVRAGKKFPTLMAIINEYARRSGVRPSPTTIKSDLNAEGITSMIRPRVVNNDPTKNKARLDFAKDCKKEEITGEKVMFSDECWVNNNDNTNRREWTLAGEEAPTPRVFQKRPQVRVMIWGAIGYNYKSQLVFIEGTMDANDYQLRVLPEVQKAMRRRRGAPTYFMQDGAKPHTAKTSMAWLKARGIQTLDWPAHSPHLNPIERLWNIIHIAVAKLEPTDVEDLKEKVLEVWEGLDQAMINDLVCGFDDGIRRTIREKGRPW